METFLQDLRFALRALRRSPGFTAVAVLTLALGIGANTAIFSVVNAVLLRSLPFREPDRLMSISTRYPQDATGYALSAPDFMSVRDLAEVFSGVAAYVPTEQALTGDGEPAQVSVAVVSADFLEVMGATPVLGRDFRAEENGEGRNAVVLLGHAFWRQRFGGDPRVVGRAVTLNGVTREVVGVLPPEFDFPARSQVYYPLAYDSRFSSATAEGRRSEYLGVVARLRPGVTPERAGAALRTLSGRLRQQFRETNANVSLAPTPLREELLGEVRTPLLVLLGAVGLVLLIACVNVANLLLARSTARESEMAVRVALGAGRGRLVRQLLTESLVLGTLGGAVGLLLAVWGTHALVAVRPAEIPRLDAVRIDATVVAFAAAATLLTATLFGSVPALQVGRGGLAGSIRESGRSGGAGRSKRRLRASLVVVETALAVMLLVGAGLLIRSFARLTHVDPGFRTERVVTFELTLPRARYAEDPQILDFSGRLLQRVRALPGVQSAGISTGLPLSGARTILGFDIENHAPPRPGFIQDLVVKRATPDYLRTMGIPVLRGRDLDERDRADAPGVALLNEAAVKRYFPDEDPLGRRITFDGRRWLTIVGVVRDVPQFGLAEETRSEAYVPFAQLPSSSLVMAARTTGDVRALTGALRREVRALDPDLPIERFTTTRELVRESVARPRFYALLLSVFAAVALALAAIGIYGVISYSVAQRTREIGVRVALGAAPESVLRLVLRSVLALAALGVGLGLLLALAGTRLIAGMLFSVGAADPPTFAMVAIGLFLVAVLAGWLPARRATRVDPMVALRAE
jgi:predicted permease